MQDFKFFKKNIGSLGGLDIFLPVLEFGGKKPKLCLVATQHGGETSGLLVINKLIDRLKNGNVPCRIIPIANPLGLAFRTREEPLDRENLNRSYPGNAEKNFTQKLAASVLGLVKDAECVLDLHTFTNRQTGILGVCRKDSRMTDKNDFFLRELAPDAIWEIDKDKTEDRQFAGDLDSVLGRAGIPAVGLELPRQQNITDQQINRVLEGIERLLKSLDSGGFQQKKNSGSIPVYRVKSLYAPISGIFTPTAKVFDKIPTGGELGRMRGFADFQNQSVKTNAAGTIITLHYPDAVKIGEKLASIGTLARTI